MAPTSHLICVATLSRAQWHSGLSISLDSGEYMCSDAEIFPKEMVFDGAGLPGGSVEQYRPGDHFTKKLLRALKLDFAFKNKFVSLTMNDLEYLRTVNTMKRQWDIVVGVSWK